MSSNKNIFERLTTMDVLRELRNRGLPITGTLQEQFDRFFHAWSAENPNVNEEFSDSSSEEEDEDGNLADIESLASSDEKSVKVKIEPADVNAAWGNEDVQPPIDASSSGTEFQSTLSGGISTSFKEENMDDSSAETVKVEPNLLLSDQDLSDYAVGMEPLGSQPQSPED